MCHCSVYVDDLIVNCSSDLEISKIKSAFCKRFDMKDVGLLNYFLGKNRTEF